MRLCEVCGVKEEVEESGAEQTQSVMLHVCENCREDRKLPSGNEWPF